MLLVAERISVPAPVFTIPPVPETTPLKANWSAVPALKLLMSKMASLFKVIPPVSVGLALAPELKFRIVRFPAPAATTRPPALLKVRVEPTLSEVSLAPPPRTHGPVPMALASEKTVTLPSLMFIPPDQPALFRTKRTKPAPVLLIVPTPDTEPSNWKPVLPK